MNKRAIYRSLEKTMLGYADLVGVPVRAVREPMVVIDQTERLQTRPVNGDMQDYTGKCIYVRQGVYERLLEAASILESIDPELCLQVVYGYRALSVQTRLYKQHEAALAAEFQGGELREAVHREIASPDIAGHPTGGAIDIQIVRNGQPLDMGTKIWEFCPDSFTFSPFVSTDATKNRLLLRDALMRVGFAPFDGEWWHFSYGDKEWARYYKRPYARYEQIEFTAT